MIYTRKGDDGTTSLIGGTRVRKDDLRVEVYGSIDELNSYVGLIRELTENEQYKQHLLKIQNLLFNAESLIACEDKEIAKTLPSIRQEHIDELERAIDAFTKVLPPLTQFVLPGGSVLSAHINVARTICRRVERLCVKFNAEQSVDNMVLCYLNRLSDYLFALSRKEIYDCGKIETYWNKSI
ncbi:MAG: cob(I)yrinic acid a,c-diamide adenosyltransferase [Bacteroidales bacterium]|jgi:cob(I)alamin adenosyltransferase|nr:cob(I)yrinic acid a,c-diamide adenosyltransferase [Bacteroidales bacterium]